jgi:hypothetical protein
MDELTALRAEIKAKAGQTAIDFLRAELEVAATLISVAETTSQHNTAVRNLRNAWLALKAADEFANQLDLEDTERSAFRDRHGDLCLRLANVHIRSLD